MLISLSMIKDMLAILEHSRCHTRVWNVGTCPKMNLSWFAVDSHGKRKMPSKRMTGKWCANCGAKYDNNSYGCVVVTGCLPTEDLLLASNSLHYCEGQWRVFRRSGVANEWAMFFANEGVRLWKGTGGTGGSGGFGNAKHGRSQDSKKTKDKGA